MFGSSRSFDPQRHVQEQQRKVEGSFIKKINKKKQVFARKLMEQPRSGFPQRPVLTWRQRPAVNCSKNFVRKWLKSGQLTCLTQSNMDMFCWSLQRTCLLPPQRGQRSGSPCRSSVKGGGKSAALLRDTLLCFCCTSEADVEWTVCVSVHFSQTADGVDCVPWKAAFLQCNLTQCWRLLCVQSVPGDEMKGEFRGKQWTFKELAVMQTFSTSNIQTES